MSHRSVLHWAPALVAFLLLPACGGGSSGGSPSSAGSSSGGPQGIASGSNSSGAPASGSTGAASGTATSGGATGSTSPEAGGPMPAEAGDAHPGAGGGAPDDIGIINQYQTQSNIAPLVANLDAFVTRLNLDGVDVDLERGSYMKATGNFPAFVNKVVSTFRPEGKLVTTALAQYIVQDAGGGGAGGAALNAVLGSYDFINLMIYSTNMSTYTNELNWWTANTGLPKTKLVWGVDFSPGKLTAAMEKQLTTPSNAYGAIMRGASPLRGNLILSPPIPPPIYHHS